MTTIRAALDAATQRLTAVRQASQLPVDNPRLDAQVLLGAVLDKERSYLYMYPEQELSPAEEERWQRLLARRAQGEPVAYLLGHRDFYGLDFTVDQRVLIPRPETELLVEEALAICQRALNNGHSPVVADIGTGSGAIPISIAVHEPRLPFIYACDVSPDALAVARLNSQRHQVGERVRLLQGDLLEPLPEPVDLLLANLPYVGTDEQSAMTPDVVNYEPHLALFSGTEGLELLTRLLNEAAHGRKLRADAILLLEIGFRQREALTSLAHSLWSNAHITCLRDYAGWDRLLRIELAG
ncbi:MAG TPA: peptide chain release factor N(5)-glutamine methyltransferase [Ktedonobacteraceae bacterium]|nr:peptide chain release factor N(5)-glutamine methyltransferase [Ktedonobacteraceae bacterium]